MTIIVEPVKCNILFEEASDRPGFLFSTQEYNRIFAQTFHYKDVDLMIDGTVRHSTFQFYELVEEERVSLHIRELFISNSGESVTCKVQALQGAIYRVGFCTFSCKGFIDASEPANIYIFYTENEHYERLGY